MTCDTYRLNKTNKKIKKTNRNKINEKVVSFLCFWCLHFFKKYYSFQRSFGNQQEKEQWHFYTHIHIHKPTYTYTFLYQKKIWQVHCRCFIRVFFTSFQISFFFFFAFFLLLVVVFFFVLFFCCFVFAFRNYCVTEGFDWTPPILLLFWTFLFTTYLNLRYQLTRSDCISDYWFGALEWNHWTALTRVSCWPTGFSLTLLIACWKLGNTRRVVNPSGSCYTNGDAIELVLRFRMDFVISISLIENLNTTDKKKRVVEMKTKENNPW